MKLVAIQVLLNLERIDLFMVYMVYQPVLVADEVVGLISDQVIHDFNFVFPFPSFSSICVSCFDADSHGGDGQDELKASHIKEISAHIGGTSTTPLDNDNGNVGIDVANVIMDVPEELRKMKLRHKAEQTPDDDDNDSDENEDKDNDYDEDNANRDQDTGNANEDDE